MTSENWTFEEWQTILLKERQKLEDVINKNIPQLWLSIQLVTAGKLCIYHADLEETSRVTHTPPGAQIGTITDIAIQNPSTGPIDFPPTSTVVIGVNEIETGAGEIEH